MLTVLLTVIWFYSRPGYRPQRPDGWDYNRRPEPTTANPNRPRPGYITVSVSMPQNR